MAGGAALGRHDPRHDPLLRRSAVATFSRIDPTVLADRAWVGGRRMGAHGRFVRRRMVPGRASTVGSAMGFRAGPVRALAHAGFLGFEQGADLCRGFVGGDRRWFGRRARVFRGSLLALRWCRRLACAVCGGGRRGRRCGCCLCDFGFRSGAGGRCARARRGATGSGSFCRRSLARCLAGRGLAGRGRSHGLADRPFARRRLARRGLLCGRFPGRRFPGR